MYQTNLALNTVVIVMLYLMYIDNGRYALCLSPQFIKIFRGLYDDNKDDLLTPDQKAMLFTSMVVQPEILMLKVCTMILFMACW